MKLRYTLPLGLAAALLLAASRIEVGRTPEKTFGAVTTVDPGPRTYTGQAKGPSARPHALYRWRGADGQVQVQSQPPPQGVRAEVFRLTREDARGGQRGAWTRGEAFEQRFGYRRRSLVGLLAARLHRAQRSPGVNGDPAQRALALAGRLTASPLNAREEII
ncbi:MAG: DUF4124 domain-containing protein [Pseudomonadota bacterium]|nr:DUF4124 domain-containing protein [Pseudomonadota bacterium]